MKLPHVHNPLVEKLDGPEPLYREAGTKCRTAMQRADYLLQEEGGCSPERAAVHGRIRHHQPQETIPRVVRASVLMAKRSLLQSIRDKELETNVNLDAARREAVEVVEAATRDAAGILETAEKEAARAAEGYIRRETERVSREVEETRARELERVRQAAEAGKGHVHEAVEEIVRAVVPD